MFEELPPLLMLATRFVSEGACAAKQNRDQCVVSADKRLWSQQFRGNLVSKISSEKFSNGIRNYGSDIIW